MRIAENSILGNALSKKLYRIEGKRKCVVEQNERDKPCRMHDLAGAMEIEEPNEKCADYQNEQRNEIDEPLIEDRIKQPHVGNKAQ